MRRLLLLALLVTVCLVPVPAGAVESRTVASRTVDLAVPSRFVDAGRVRFVGPDHPGDLRVRVLLPRGYEPTRRYPVLYLLHGFGEAYDTWSRASDPRAVGGVGGDVAAVTGDLQALVVMPEGADAWWTDWWNVGRRGDPQWGRWLTEEVVPAVERRFRVSTGRDQRSVAGFSMGGFGALHLAARRPDLFGTALSFSGAVSLGLAPSLPATPALDDRMEEVFGPRLGFYRAGLDPLAHVEGLRHTRLWLSWGDGVPAAQDGPDETALGVPLELGVVAQNEQFRDRAVELGVAVTAAQRLGIHSYRYVREDLRRAIGWGLFGGDRRAPREWEHLTVLPLGRAFDVAYRVDGPLPTQAVRFVRTPGRLRGEGTGTVCVDPDAGPARRLVLPFDVALP